MTTHASASNTATFFNLTRHYLNRFGSMLHVAITHRTSVLNAAPASREPKEARRVGRSGSHGSNVHSHQQNAFNTLSFRRNSIYPTRKPKCRQPPRMSLESDGRAAITTLTRTATDSSSLPSDASYQYESPSTSDAGENATPLLLNNWWPIAFEHALSKDAPLAVQCFGEPLVS